MNKHDGNEKKPNYVFKDLERLRNPPQGPTPRAKRLKIGTIVEFEVSEGLAYVQYFHKATYSGHCIRVFKGIYQERPADFATHASQMEQLMTFYPITNGIAYELCEVVGWAPVPERLRELPLFKVLWGPDCTLGPSPYRWKLMNAETGKSWRVGGETDDRQKVREILPEEYHHLPTWCINCYSTLLDAIELGWTNESDIFEDFWEARNRLPRAQEYMRVAAEIEAAKSPKKKKTVATERPDPPRPNPIAELLKKLLTRMDGIMEKHDELQDTDVRDQVHEAVFDAFVLAKADYELPEEFGMSTKAGNKRVRSALAAFLTKATSVATKANLNPGPPRLAAFQDIEVTSDNGSTYDDYFGDRPGF